jgi:hypothetical protein
MLCRIADLVTEVPAVGDLVSRCSEYLCDGDAGADIVIRTESFRPDSWRGLSGDKYIYCETGSHFFFQLLKFKGLMLHASAVELDGKAYLFSAPSGTGKSTHTRLWQSTFGENARVFNDDKPALRFIDGVWYAYGSPWCGKDGININMKAPVAGICFLKQAPENRIRRLGKVEAAQNLIWQTMHRFKHVENLDLMLSHVENLVERIPVFELENRPEPEAALLSYNTMRQAAEEIGL